MTSPVDRVMRRVRTPPLLDTDGNVSVTATGTVTMILDRRRQADGSGSNLLKTESQQRGIESSTKCRQGIWRSADSKSAVC